MHRLMFMPLSLKLNVDRQNNSLQIVLFILKFLKFFQRVYAKYLYRHYESNNEILFNLFYNIFFYSIEKPIPKAHERRLSIFEGN